MNAELRETARKCGSYAHLPSGWTAPISADFLRLAEGVQEGEPPPPDRDEILELSTGLGVSPVAVAQTTLDSIEISSSLAAKQEELAPTIHYGFLLAKLDLILGSPVVWDFEHQPVLKIKTGDIGEPLLLFAVMQRFALESFLLRLHLK